MGATCSDDLRGAEIQIYRNQDASWRSAHIVEIASATDGVLDGMYKTHRLPCIQAKCVI
jgi:hypothetical protein